MLEITKRESATIVAALGCWKEELAEGGEWIRESLIFAQHAPLSIQEVDELAERLKKTPDQAADDFHLFAPTYNYQLYPKYVQSGAKPEFGLPEIPVVARAAQGIRIALGTHNYDDTSKPDVQIERHPNGWMIFLHPLGGSDACGYIYFFDDGQSCLLPEYGYGPTPAIRILAPGSRLPEFDAAD
ncbi:MAG TPA: hypothetical protein VFE46_12940 [Pirellulales bacterium]|jgi:hypothetical protein|nr:hypothetical protein [Pirellulales bacterium]